jgi:hypothetical protein
MSSASREAIASRNCASDGLRAPVAVRDVAFGVPPTGNRFLGRVCGMGSGRPFPGRLSPIGQAECVAGSSSRQPPGRLRVA